MSGLKFIHVNIGGSKDALPQVTKFQYIAFFILQHEYLKKTLKKPDDLQYIAILDSQNRWLIMPYHHITIFGCLRYVSVVHFVWKLAWYWIVWHIFPLLRFYIIMDFLCSENILTLF